MTFWNDGQNSEFSSAVFIIIMKPRRQLAGRLAPHLVLSG